MVNFESMANGMVSIAFIFHVGYLAFFALIYYSMEYDSPCTGIFHYFTLAKPFEAFVHTTYFNWKEKCPGLTHRKNPFYRKYLAFLLGNDIERIFLYHIGTHFLMLIGCFFFNRGIVNGRKWSWWIGFPILGIFIASCVLIFINDLNVPDKNDRIVQIFLGAFGGQSVYFGILFIVSLFGYCRQSGRISEVKENQEIEEQAEGRKKGGVVFDISCYEYKRQKVKNMVDPNEFANPTMEL